MAVSLTASAKVVPSRDVRTGKTPCPTGFDDYSLINVAAKARLAAGLCMRLAWRAERCGKIE